MKVYGFIDWLLISGFVPKELPLFISFIICKLL